MLVAGQQDSYLGIPHPRRRYVCVLCVPALAVKGERAIAQYEASAARLLVVDSQAQASDPRAA